MRGGPNPMWPSSYKKEERQTWDDLKTQKDTAHKPRNARGPEAERPARPPPRPQRGQPCPLWLQTSSLQTGRQSLSVRPQFVMLSYDDPSDPICPCCTGTLFLLIAKKDSIVWIYHILVYPVNIWVVLTFLTRMKNAPYKHTCLSFYMDRFYFLLGIYLRMELLGHTTLFNFLRNCQTFPK